MSLKRARLFTISILIAMTLATSAAAQDAGQVLRVSVGYTTLKNSTELTPEKRELVDRLGKQAQQANAAGKYGEALKHYYHAITVMRGGQWTPARALGSALTVKLSRAVIEPGQSVALRLGQLFLPDEKLAERPTLSITLSKLEGQQQAKTLKSVSSMEPDFISNPFATEISVPDLEAGKYRLAVRLEATGSEPIVKNISVHIERGLQEIVSAERVRLASIEARLKAERKDALLAQLPSAEYRLSLIDLANASEINLERINFREEIKEAGAMLDALGRGRDPMLMRRGDFRKAYRSKVDDTLQPYRLFVPASYDGSKAFPLIIALHGMGGDENSYFEAYEKGAFKIEAERRGYIVACPKGRKSASMYLGDAERDVMDVLAEMKRAYKIDPDRVYMTGHSMGGFGSWSVAMNHPNVFAAIAPVAGGGLPMFMNKIAHIPQLVVHGDNDKTVPVERSRVMVAAAKGVQAEVKYIEVPGGSHGDVVAPTFKDVFDWFDAHRRKSADAKAAAAAAGKNN